MTSSTPDPRRGDGEPEVPAQPPAHAAPAGGRPVPSETPAADQPVPAETSAAAPPPGAPSGAEPAAAEPPAGAPPAAESAGTEPAAEPEYRVADLVDRSTVRRAPRFGRFVLAGILVGAVVSAGLAVLSPSDHLARSDLFWLLFLSLGAAGALAGLGVAVFLDRRSWEQRASRTGARPAPGGPVPGAVAPGGPAAAGPVDTGPAAEEAAGAAGPGSDSHTTEGGTTEGGTPDGSGPPDAGRPRRS
ncbi:hypothetical protein [Georgenia thermotolerans]|uniref:Uncharacterized protein n=1 Tax=Georgenia thermotolerans TaxID=527326 RepID=A0A7J5UQG9_9MICO|nr:hypothetical protein [Georgenia thermotolerans]KAE8764619.1 hypothetical protein GB883_08100 [Georgenia thermotolerans]